jgi:hypothetical protein
MDMILELVTVPDHIPRGNVTRTGAEVPLALPFVMQLPDITLPTA